MKQINVTKDYVAFTKIVNGEVVIDAKTDGLRKGTHPLQDIFSFIETDDKAVYDAWEVYTPPVPVQYNPSTLMSWCIDVPLQSAEFLALPDSVRMLAISFTQTFAMNCNSDGAALYRKSAQLCDVVAGNTVCSTMAETIIGKAIEMNANIT